MFTDLDKVEVGDHFTIEVLGEILEYEVRATRVVDPDAGRLLELVEGEDLITLVTCTPLGINSPGILVTGTRVNPASRRPNGPSARSRNYRDSPGSSSGWGPVCSARSGWPSPSGRSRGSRPGRTRKSARSLASRPDLASRPETGIQDSPETAASP